MSSISPSPLRRRKRVWRSARSGYSPKLVAWMIGVVVSLLVIGGTILFSELRKHEAAGQPANRVLSEVSSASG